MVQYVKNNQYNTPHSESEGQKPLANLNQCRKNKRQDPTPFHYKNTQQMVNRARLTQQNQAIQESPRPTSYTKVKDKALSLSLGTKQGCPLLSSLVNTVLEATGERSKRNPN